MKSSTIEEEPTSEQQTLPTLHLLNDDSSPTNPLYSAERLPTIPPLLHTEGANSKTMPIERDSIAQQQGEADLKSKPNNSIVKQHDLKTPPRDQQIPSSISDSLVQSIFTAAFTTSSAASRDDLPQGQQSTSRDGERSRPVTVKLELDSDESDSMKDDDAERQKRRKMRTRRKASTDVTSSLGSGAASSQTDVTRCRRNVRRFRRRPSHQLDAYVDAMLGGLFRQALEEVHNHFAGTCTCSCLYM